MKHISISVLVLITGLVFSTPSRPEMTPDFPTHCKQGEFAFLNARMGKFDKKDNLVQSGKVISLCADKPKEPFGIFVYRFGAIGNIEMEQVATPSEPFGIYNLFIGHNAGENIFYFNKGPIEYFVSEATGMGSGITVVAAKSGKKIAYFFSGNDNAREFQSNLEEINFDEAKSPVFIAKEPKHDLEHLFVQ